MEVGFQELSRTSRYICTHLLHLNLHSSRHQNRTRFGGGRNGGLIAQRPLSKFVRQLKTSRGTVEQLANILLDNGFCIVFSDIVG
ncbi:MAG: hypothetical protein V7L11_08640 [Nostoc sp.]|uniref:hypothetical protein n=1 Tax=Nostoc sp. TaxID=1180 RepID=UPI002FFB2199